MTFFILLKARCEGVKAEKTRKRLEETFDVVLKPWDCEKIMDCHAELDQFEADAELGRAVRKAFEEGKELYSGVLYEMGGYAEIASYNIINTKQDLLEWAKEVE
jgi:hypothetical protein